MTSATHPTSCDNCDEPIVHTSEDDFLSAALGPPEWVHARTGAPECRHDGHLACTAGCHAEPGEEWA